MNYNRNGMPGILLGFSDRNLNLLIEGMPFFLDNSDMGFDGVTMVMYAHSEEELNEYITRNNVLNNKSRIGGTKLLTITPQVVKTLKSGEIICNQSKSINDDYPVELMLIHRETEEDIIKSLTEELGFEIEGLL